VEVTSKVASPEGLFSFTPSGTRFAGGNWFTVDYVVSSMLCHGSRLESNLSNSDHWPLLFTFEELRIQPPVVQPRPPQLKREVAVLDLVSTLLTTNWPLRQFDKIHCLR